MRAVSANQTAQSISRLVTRTALREPNSKTPTHMNTKTLKLLTALLFCFLVAMPGARAWDNPGHMAVAGLAYDELSSAQQKELANLIRKHPGFDLITPCFTDPDIDDRELVMAAATWPDLSKFDTRHYHNNGYEETNPP